MDTTNTSATSTVRTPMGGSARLNAVDWIALVLLIVGGLNWGSVGLAGVDLVATIFGAMSGLSRLVYVLVGLSAIYVIYLATRLRK